jgi:cholesterol transport system auxiliary component
MKRLAVVVAAASALGLTACVSVLPNPIVPDALIELPVERANPPAAELLADINVYPPDATRATSGADIAVRTGGELVFLADVRWSDAAPRLLQSAVVNSLSKAKGPGHANAGQMGVRSDYDLRWRIVDLSVGKETAPVRAEVTASIVDSQTRRIIAQQGFRAEGVPVSGTPRDRAAALAQAAQSIADQVSAFAAQSAPKPPAS